MSAYRRLGASVAAGITIGYMHVLALVWPVEKHNITPFKYTSA